jgi:hypothetical protein
MLNPKQNNKQNVRLYDILVKSFIRGLMLLFLPVFFSAAAFAQTVEFPIMQSITYFPYSDNSLPENGEVSVGLDLNYSNVYMFNHHRTIINDFEMFSGTLRFRYGLSERAGMGLELYLRWSSIFGGGMDGTIENFHSFFGLPDNARSEFPRNSVHFRYKDSFYHVDEQNALSPLVFALFKTLSASDHFSLYARTAVGIPLSNVPGLSSSRPFFTGGIIFYYQKNRFSIDFSSYLSFAAAPRWLDGENLRSTIFLSRLELNWKRFIGGVTYRTSAFKEDDISHPAYQCYVGYRLFNPIDFIIIEDFDPFDTTPDIGIFLRIRVLLKKMKLF